MVDKKLLFPALFCYQIKPRFLHFLGLMNCVQGSYECVTAVNRDIMLSVVN